MTKSRLVISYVIIAVLLITASLLCIFVGTTKIDISEITKAGSVSNSIVLNIRIPRMLAAIFAGGALSVSGYCLQTFFHNPIAGPYLLGISSGAKLFVAVVMIKQCCINTRSISWCNVSNGICYYYFKESKKHVNASCMWSNDWVYMHGNM